MRKLTKKDKNKLKEKAWEEYKKHESPLREEYLKIDNLAYVKYNPKPNTIDDIMQDILGPLRKLRTGKKAIKLIENSRIAYEKYESLRLPLYKKYDKRIKEIDRA